MQKFLNILDKLIDTAKYAGASAADAVLFSSADVSVSVRHGKQEELERAESTGLGLRVWVGDKQAIVSSSDIAVTDFPALVERAVAMAKAAPPDSASTLADKEYLAGELPVLDLCDYVEPSVESMREQCEATEAAALAQKGITNSEGADAHFDTTNIAIATSHGFAREYKSSSASLSISVVAGSGTDMERDYDYTSARFVSDLASPESIGKEAARLTLARLNPRKIETQNLPVVFDPRVGKSMAGYLAGAIRGSAIARGTSFLKDKMGEQIFPKNIQIIDDPHRVRGLASRPFDGEGVATRKLSLIENGVLKSWILDTRSANKLGLTTTGHASRGTDSPPSPSTSNLHIEAGEKTPEQMLKDIKNGIYITDTFGMGVNLITGDYSQGAAGFMIENGVITYPVSEFTIAGKLADMFKNLEAANDLKFRYSTNVPTLLVGNMMIAGG